MQFNFQAEQNCLQNKTCSNDLTIYVPNHVYVVLNFKSNNA